MSQVCGKCGNRFDDADVRGLMFHECDGEPLKRRDAKKLILISSLTTLQLVGEAAKRSGHDGALSLAEAIAALVAETTTELGKEMAK